MKPKISLITLGVADLERSREFYEKLGFVREGNGEGIVFFKNEGTWLALFPKEELKKDIGIDSLGDGNPSFTLAHNVASEEKVDEVIEEARGVGAEIAKEPQKVFWGGYSGYFKDPDGYFWEVAYNPFMDLT